MICPYCAEEIKAEAIICRHCRQNLVPFKSIEERLKQVEDQLSAIAEVISEITSAINTNRQVNLVSSTDSLSTFPLVKIILSILLPILFTATLSYFRHAFRADLGLLYILFISGHSPLGVWLGISWPKSHLKSYVLIGLVLGILDLLTISLIFGELPPLPVYYVYIIAPPFLMFISSSLFGDLIERKLYPDRSQTGYAEKLATKLISSSKKPGDKLGGAKATYEDRVKRLAGFISALTPILTLIGTVITGILTYLAAIKKATP